MFSYAACTKIDAGWVQPPANRYRGWHQREMACITDREIELFSKRHELIDTLSEERGSTPEEERRIAQQERDSKTTKLFHGKTEIENWRQQMGPQRWDSITPE